MARGLVEVRVGRGLQVEPVGNLRAGKDYVNSRGESQRPGTYTAQGVKDQLQANSDIADHLQGQIVQRMKNHIAFGKRAAASTGHLVKVTADAGNRVVTKNFIGVGIESHLNGASAYWRIFEEGTHGFVGTPLFGMGGAKFPNAHGDKPGLRTMTEAALAENEARHRDRLDAMEEGDGAPRSSGRLFVVQHEIEAANIYSAVAADNRGSFGVISVQFAQRVLREALKEVVVVSKDFVPPSVR